MSSLQIRLDQLGVRVALPSSRLFWIALQVPVFLALNYDVQIYFNAATGVLNGQLPYRDFFFQYPPLSLLFFIPPRLLTADLAGYFLGFNIELLVLACVGVLAVLSLARHIGQPGGPTLLVYSLALLALGAIVPQRYDLVPAILVVLALAAWLNGKHDSTYALLAAGALVKLYPALLVPLLSVVEWRTAGSRTLVRGWLIFGGVLLAVLLPFLLLAPQETLNAFAGQAGRGIGIASVYASLLLAGRAVGVPAQIIYDQGLNSWNVTVPQADWLATAATGLQLLLLVWVYLRFLRSQDTASSTLLRYAAAIIGVGLVASKVLSAQYLIWLFPLAFLCGDRRFVWAAALFLAASVLTQALYPFLWNDMKQGALIPLLVALVRDACLVALCLLLLGPAQLEKTGV